jgi:hypothetical protein
MVFSYLVYRVAERPLQEFVKARRRGRSPLPPVSPPAPPAGMSFASGEKASVP